MLDWCSRFISININTEFTIILVPFIYFILLIYNLKQIFREIVTIYKYNRSFNSAKCFPKNSNANRAYGRRYWIRLIVLFLITAGLTWYINSTQKNLFRQPPTLSFYLDNQMATIHYYEQVGKNKSSIKVVLDNTKFSVKNDSTAIYLFGPNAISFPYHGKGIVITKLNKNITEIKFGKILLSYISQNDSAVINNSITHERYDCIILKNANSSFSEKIRTNLRPQCIVVIGEHEQNIDNKLLLNTFYFSGNDTLKFDLQHEDVVIINSAVEMQ